MGRTNVVVDDELVERVMRLYRLKTMREAIDLALKQLVGDARPGDILRLKGMGWEGDLDEMRSSRVDHL